MPRIKRGVAARNRKHNILRHAKGYRGRRKNLIRTAKEAVAKGWNYSYRDRRTRKREFRRLWIARINAASRLHDLSYSRMMYGLKNAGVELDRKVLADMAVNDAAGFAQLAELAKANQQAPAA
ncbi:50S ribosomal protein L20 [Candidatus Poribacteria bacterium]|jgi:large subunit ribosomal protein L20|nr:50S ribosomal protein L20 [Candidatus Poribacteria bacterium]MBT5533451.1 50S ribosomal protein L20 [Candidatus Poribacteria bacterium]MBT5709999.1 50S ribosomal protein L20 [Candidatus Poribacteria bacterium]MBT7099087.1 50S ribosomal protein L20 [Candidatus Poribacteria bacterium]MBT7805809.1 50S ribosomal protein L20 [Candidatus Poribacteria bacterium]